MKRPKAKEPYGARHGGMSHREIGRALGISHTRVEQIERRALEKLRVVAERRGLRP